MRLIDADKLPHYDGTALSAAEVARAVEAAPTIEAKLVKHGKWIVDDEFIDCSACGHEKWSKTPYEDLVKRFRYCPNCGAKMDEVEE